MDDGGTEPRGNSISYDGRNHRRGGECTRLGAAADFLVLRMVKRALGNQGEKPGKMKPAQRAHLYTYTRCAAVETCVAHSI